MAVNLNHDEEFLVEARILIVYICKIGKEIDRQTLDTVFEFESLLGQKIPAEKVSEFWLAYNSLARLALPATVETIRANLDFAGEDENTEGLESRRMIKRYSILAVVTLLFILLTQVYWVVGDSVIHQVKGVEAAAEDLKQKKREIDGELASLTRFAAMYQDGHIEDAKAVEAKIGKLTREKEGILTDITNVKYQMEALYRTLRLTTLHIPDSLMDQDEPRTDLYYKFQALINETVYRYILPLVLGLLGACVNVLRRMSIQIQNLTFSPDNGVRYQLRICLGMIAGLTFSWLMPADESNTLLKVSPLAIAFAVGYSVEILFTGLDKLIRMLTGKGASEEEAPAASKGGESKG